MKMVWRPPAHPQPHPANADGDFYVTDGCCITCGIPLLEAPNVFAWTEEPEGQYSHCIVAAQPQTPADVHAVIRAIHAAEVDCIRYRGRDSDIARRIVEIGCAEQCDEPPPDDAQPLVRSHVTFTMAPGAGQPSTEQLASAFLAHFYQSFAEDRRQDCGIRFISASARRSIVHISWAETMYHSVGFENLGNDAFLVVTNPAIAAAGIGVSRTVEEWLQSDDRFEDIRWCTLKQWFAGGPYRETVA